MRFLFVDQILKRNHPRHIIGLKHITPEDPFLCRSAEKDSLCFIPSLIGETIGQLAAWLVMHEQHFMRRPVAGVVAEAIMHRPAYVGETLLLECEIDALDDVAVEYHGHASVDGELVFSVIGAIGPMLPMQDFIDEALVKQQFVEIDRPIDTCPKEYIAGLPRGLQVQGGQEYVLQFDAITAMQPEQSCRAVKKISRSALYFADHFPNKPVLPLTVLLEFIRKLASDFLQASNWQHRFQLVRMERIKMSEFVQPGEVIESELLVKKMSDTGLILHIRTYVNQKRICVVDLVYQHQS
jgi:3-hydroxymyristoyl/3-hydroxydecanoyl-(acyl carrier protein) dehydratase